MLSLLLFLMQMHGYSHVSDPDEFGFSADNHFHEHLKMAEARAAELIQKNVVPEVLTRSHAPAWECRFVARARGSHVGA